MTHADVRERRQERGFTLIEVLVAMIILIFGVAAVANLMVVAATSNTAANHSTAATNAATQVMELLKSAPYNTLVTGGSVTVDAGATGVCGATPVTATFNCDTPTAGANPQFRGVGRFHVRWEVTAPAGPAPGIRFIQVAAESQAPMVSRRSRVLLTTFRTQ